MRHLRSPTPAALVQSSDDLMPALVMLAVLLGLVILLGLVLAYARRRTLGRAQDRAGAGLFEDLRKMRERGEISDEEYAAARKSVVDRLAGPKTTPESDSDEIGASDTHR